MHSTVNCFIRIWNGFPLDGDALVFDNIAHRPRERGPQDQASPHIQEWVQADYVFVLPAVTATVKQDANRIHPVIITGKIS
jgi:hypothetical protein